MPLTGYYDVSRNSLPSYSGYQPWTPSQIINPTYGLGTPNPNEADGGWYATNLDGSPMHAVTGDQYRTLIDSTHSNRELLQSAAKIAALIYGGGALSGTLGSAGLGFGSGAAGAGELAGTGYASASDAAYGSTAAGGSGSGLASVLGSGSAATPTVAGSLAGVAGTGASSMALPGWANLAVSAFNGILGNSAANRATNASTAADQAAIGEIGRQYDQSRTDQMPWLQAGQNALGRLQDPNAFQASPDYAFRRSEGQRDIGNSFAARGGAASGNALRALTEFNQNLASGEFGNWWNRQAGLAGVGQTAANSLGQYGANAATNTANLTSNQGATRASGILGGAAAIGNAVNDGYSNYLYQNGGGYLPRARYGR